MDKAGAEKEPDSGGEKNKLSRLRNTALRGGGGNEWAAGLPRNRETFFATSKKDSQKEGEEVRDRTRTGRLISWLQNLFISGLSQNKFRQFFLCAMCAS